MNLTKPFLNCSCTECFLKTDSSTTCVLWDRYVVFNKRLYTEGTVFKKPALLEPLVKVVMLVFMRIQKNVKKYNHIHEKKTLSCCQRNLSFDSTKRPKNHYYRKNTKTILKLVMLLFVLEWTHRLQRVPYGHRKDYKINTHTVNYSKNPGYSKNKTQIHSVTLTETWF